MTTVSIGKAWEDSIAFVAREWHLLFPVAFLFVALPVAILQQMVPPEMAQWALNQQGTPPPLPGSFVAVMLLTGLITCFGSLALYALALRPGISVGEALQLGVRRFGALVLVFLLLMGALMAFGIVFGLVFALFAMLSKLAASVLAGLLFMAGMIFGVLAGVRLMLLNPVLVDGDLGPFDSLRRSWELSRGHFWRLFGFLIVTALLSFIISETAQVVFGSIAGIIGGATAATVVGGLLGIVASTVIQVYFLVMIARIYRQLEAA
jgi:hypothetical protein